MVGRDGETRWDAVSSEQAERIYIYIYVYISLSLSLSLFVRRRERMALRLVYVGLTSTFSIRSAQATRAHFFPALPLANLCWPRPQPFFDCPINLLSLQLTVYVCNNDKESHQKNRCVSNTVGGGDVPPLAQVANRSSPGTPI